MAFKNLVGMGEKGATTGSPSSWGESTPSSSASVPRSVAPSTSIDATTQLSGKIRCDETMRIDGRVKGEIRCGKTVFVGKGAVIDALIQADSVVIAGEVKGDIEAKRTIKLESTALVTGDLATPGIVIEEGAKLEGRIVIGGEEPKAEKSSAARAPAASRETSSPSTAPSSGATVSPS